MPKLGHRLPKHVLTAGEAEAIISIPDVNTKGGIRDRAILETLYSTGIRRMEVVNLRLYDIDYDRGTIMVRQGKGQKDRMVPIGERALAWIERYVEEVRPILEAGDTEDNTLLLTDLGRPFTPDQMTADAAPLRGRRERRQAWRVSFMAAHGGDGAARRRRRHPFHPGVPGPCPLANDRDLHAGEHSPTEGDPLGLPSVREAEAPGEGGE